MSLKSEPPAQDPEPSALAGRRPIDRRTRALARLILGQRVVSDLEVQVWLEERMAFSQQDAAVRRQALEEANAIVDEAKTRPSRISRLRQVRRALHICPECARAYVALALEGAQNKQQALDLFRLGVRAAERTLGRQGMKRWAGRFGETPETRDYLDARLGVANMLWTLDLQHEAVSHYREILALDAVDSSGVRFILLFYSLAMYDTTLTEELLARYADDDYAEWLYSTALYRYRREGDSPTARATLHAAFEANPFISAYLQGADLPLAQLSLADSPGSDEPGSEGEAMLYALENGVLWETTPGAQQWLERTHQAYADQPRST